MKIRLTMTLTDSGGDQAVAQCDIDAADAPGIPAFGLGLANAKALLAWVQATLVAKQIAEYSTNQRRCAQCGRARAINDYHIVCYRSLFGDTTARIARYCNCTACDTPRPAAVRQRWISAEMEYIHSQLAATVPYARANELLRLLLPRGKGAASSTVRTHTLLAGERLNLQDLAPSDHAQRGSELTKVVGLDGGYVRHCKPDPEVNFEVVAGRCLQSGQRQRSVAFVRIVDKKSTGRVAAMAAGASEVFTDGETQLRLWQKSALPNIPHILDWYHVRRRVGQLDRVVHGHPAARQLKARDHDRISALVGHLRWRLWHGRSAGVMRRLRVVLHILQRPAVKAKPVATHIRKLTTELLQYLQNNDDSMPDYGKRWRSGQRISSAFVESAVNQIIDKRMSKSQQMRWDPLSAHQLLQVRVRVIDGLLREDFQHWYPSFPGNEPSLKIVA